MNLAVMQPYFFPYIGYFQLISAVNTFVIYDDVNYIVRGWINRNYILLNGQRHLITLALEGASRNKLINEINIGDNKDKILQTLRHTYNRARYFGEVYPLIERILGFEDRNLAGFVSNSIRVLAGYLDMKTKFRLSSSIEKDDTLRGQDKILSMCGTLNAKRYTNAIGGRELYDTEAFRNNGIELRFIKPGNITYRQFNDGFVPNLSIIDVLMFNSRSVMKKMLKEYELVS